MSNKLHPKLTVQLFTDEKCFGPGVAQLLSLVREHHSLRAAAISMSMAYSKAWTIIKNAERELGFSLLTSTTGGKSGGGAVLTPEAERLLVSFKAYESELKAQADRLFAEQFDWLNK